MATEVFLSKFSTKMDVQSASMAELVAFYNAVSGKPAIKKFETRAKGVERCLPLLKPEGAPAPTGVNPETAPKAVVKAVAKAEHSSRKAARKPGPVTVTSPMGAIVKAVTAKPKKAPAKKPAAKKTTKPKARRATSNGERAAPLSGDAKITLVHKGENPKRAAAAERFGLYRTGMTVDAYIAAGGQRRDVVWDAKQGWITVK